MQSNPYSLVPKKFGSHERTMHVLKKHDHLTILDVGCNDGYMGEQFPNHTWHGIELREKSAQLASKRGYSMRTMNLNTEPIESIHYDTQFDALLFIDVLEHLLDPVTTIKHLSKYLKEDGIIIISLPNIANWRYRLALLFGQFNYKDSGVLDRTHTHLYTKKTALRLIHDAGLTSVTVRCTNAIFGYITWNLPWTGPLLGTSIFIVSKKSRS